MQLTILVCGGREYKDAAAEATVRRVLSLFTRGAGVHPYVTLVHGGADGADTLAHRFAVESMWKVIVVPVSRSEWDRWGPSAGHTRNRKMARDYHPDVVIAFPGGAGTAGMVGIAQEMGIPVLQVR